MAHRMSKAEAQAFAVIEGTAMLPEEQTESLRWTTAIGGRYMGADQAEAYGRGKWRARRVARPRDADEDDRGSRCGQVAQVAYEACATHVIHETH